MRCKPRKVSWRITSESEISLALDTAMRKRIGEHPKALVTIVVLIRGTSIYQGVMSSVVPSAVGRPSLVRVITKRISTVLDERSNLSLERTAALRTAVT
jgi:hypothetical protein